jgi:hypothetical protein
MHPESPEVTRQLLERGEYALFFRFSMNVKGAASFAPVDQRFAITH